MAPSPWRPLRTCQTPLSSWKVECEAVHNRIARGRAWSELEATRASKNKGQALRLLICAFTHSNMDTETHTNYSGQTKYICEPESVDQPQKQAAKLSG